MSGLLKSVRAKDFPRVLGIHKSTGWAYLKTDPTFPKPRRISPRVVVWDLDELLAWRDSKGYAPLAEPTRAREAVR